MSVIPHPPYCRCLKCCGWDMTNNLGATFNGDITRLKAERDALTARVAHLEKYAGCRWTCDSRILDDNDATKLKGLPCTCGFQFADAEKHSISTKETT